MTTEETAFDVLGIIAKALKVTGANIPSEKQAAFGYRVRLLTTEYTYELSKEAILSGNGKREALREQWHRITALVQLLIRREDLENSPNVAVLEGALRFIAEHGGEPDLQRLQQIEQDSALLDSQITRQLLGIAKERIRERMRVGPGEYPALGIPSPVDFEVRRTVKALLKSDRFARENLASRLSRLGVSRRGSNRTRGSLEEPGPSRLPELVDLENIQKLLDDPDQAVRCQVALALGEWGGEGAAQALARRLEFELNEEVQLYYIEGLKIIGGRLASDVLRRAAERSATELVREEAMAALDELATGGQVDLTEGF